VTIATVYSTGLSNAICNQRVHLWQKDQSHMASLFMWCHALDFAFLTSYEKKINVHTALGGSSWGYTK
jgi:hypothetical protein